MPKEIKRLSKKSQKLFIITVFNTVLSVALYYISGSIIQGLTGKGLIVQWVYFALVLGLGIAYVAYNKGLTMTNEKITENLPKEWSAVKKQAFIDEGKRRRDNSAWMLTLIIPIIFTFICDFVYLMYFDSFLQQM